MIFWCSASVLLAGCTAPRNPVSGSGSLPPDVTQNVSGNWVFEATPTAGPALFTQAAASLSQAQGNTLVTASLVNEVATQDSCLGANALVPLIGTQEGGELGLQSFSIDGQYINLAAKLSASGTSLLGTYAVHGGCTDGATGSISAFQLQPLTGLYVGQTSSPNPLTLSLQITQLQSSTGDGRFLLSGSAELSGSDCFDKGALNFPDGYVLGDRVTALLHTNDADGATLTLSGVLPADASSFSVNTSQIAGGACAGSLGSFLLRRVAP